MTPCGRRSTVGDGLTGRRPRIGLWMNDMSGHANQSDPFPRPFAVEDLLRLRGAAVHIAADKQECEGIARTLDLPAVISLKAEFQVRREARMIRVTGQVRAQATQLCVVSLEPFDCSIVEAVDVRFCDDPALIAAAQEAIAGNEAEWEDPPDPVLDGQIDLGAVAVEHLALGLDPHPRKPGVAFEGEPAAGQEQEASPFAVLRRLKQGDGEA